MIDPAIAVLDIALSFAIWPLVWRLYTAKTSNEHTLLASIPSGGMVAAVGVLFWMRGDILIALAHIPSALGWFLVAVLTVFYRRNAHGKGHAPSDTQKRWLFE